jgi:hypothetical protein
MERKLQMLILSGMTAILSLPLFNSCNWEDPSQLVQIPNLYFCKPPGELFTDSLKIVEDSLMVFGHLKPKEKVINVEKYYVAAGWFKDTIVIQKNVTWQFKDLDTIVITRHKIPLRYIDQEPICLMSDYDGKVYCSRPTLMLVLEYINQDYDPNKTTIQHKTCPLSGTELEF